MNTIAIQSRRGTGTSAIMSAAPPEPLQYLTFMLDGEAIGILAVKEIIEYGHLTEGR